MAGTVIPAIEVSFRMRYEIFEEDEWVVASAPDLDVHSQGHTEREAVDNLREALELFIVSCLKRSTLDQVLRDSGFAPEQGLLAASHLKAQAGVKTIEVPLHLLATRPNAEADAG
ncbi:MAG: type II toxin-antitoxin system HicB family antitoxin [Candidatus Lambdaproteobacteria bacterium]|nr:type II toxin-antitoxin system HicB family antitoxin [Candidatus Lambdaproteobacteria bacterium]